MNAKSTSALLLCGVLVGLGFGVYNLSETTPESNKDYGAQFENVDGILVNVDTCRTENNQDGTLAVFCNEAGNE